MRKRCTFFPFFTLALSLAVLCAGRIVMVTESNASPDSSAEYGRPAVRVLSGDNILCLPLEEYLVGVVAAEMPADFDPEALRAQAVAARTYTLYCAGTGKHAYADVCTDFHCCQAWKSDDAMRESWGDSYQEKLSRICYAVDSTAGQYLRFNGQAAFTAFHSSSAGFTEDCGAIWNGLPYLVSVSSPEDADSVPNYVSQVQVGVFDLRGVLLEACPEADLSGPPEEWFEEIVYDNSGRVSKAVIGSAVFSGVKLRELFKLRSTAFTLDYDEGVFTFTVTGFGHGVGMSQYGANVMAADGADYLEILAHYYPGTELVSL